MKKSWLMREYIKGDEKGILDLFNFVFNARRSIEHWNWEFKNNPAGFAKIWLAEDNNAIVGQYTIIPLRMKVGNETLMGAQSVDTITHPSYRRQGMFVTLANKVYYDAGKDGISVIYGFPTEAACHGFVKKLDWFKVCSIQRMAKPLNIKNLLRRRQRLLVKILQAVSKVLFGVLDKTKKLGAFKHFSFRRIPAFDKSVNDFWERIAGDYPIAVVKDRRYLNWRYVHKPGKQYAIFLAKKGNENLGYVVLDISAKLNEGYIVDVISPMTAVAMEYLVLKAIEYLKEQHVNVIICWTLKGNLLYKVLMKNGFLPLGKVRFIARRNAPTIDKSFLKDPRNWFITLGDSDLF